MKISLVTTVKDSAPHIEEFLGSVAAQTLAPNEVIVTDGGSTDGTLNLLRAASGITLIESPGANISKGRNVSISAAAHDVIALTDADCVLEPGWLAALASRIEAGADVAMGFYLPITDGFLQECMACVNLPISAEEVDPSTFMPSGRSVAFRREAIEAVGGFPEWLPIGEDMWVDHRWRERRLDMRFAPEAIARWRLRSGLRETWAQYFRYARGDAQAGMYPERHLLRFGVYAGLVAAARSRKAWPKLFATVGAIAYAKGPIRRGRAVMEEPAERAAATVIVPALMAWIDSAKMAGYITGMIDRAER